VRTARGHVSLEADFLVDATGRSARVSRHVGARQVRYDRLIGAAVTMKARTGEGIKDSFTLVEAVASGWWYSARVPCGRLMVVYLTDSDLLDKASAGQTESWLGLLAQTEHTSRRVADGNYSPVSEPRIYPANTARLSVITGKRWLAVGDAAVAYDPLSSYGITSSLGTGLYAAQAIAESLEEGRQSMSEYNKVIDEAFARYLIKHYDHYAIERRWPDEPFWQRRHSPSFAQE
jgi:flavin-dependent dehydrogenase